MDEQNHGDWDEEFLKAAMEVLEITESSLPSSPASVLAPPTLKISKIPTSLTQAVQFQSAAGKQNNIQRLSWRHRERALDEQRWNEEVLKAAFGFRDSNFSSHVYEYGGFCTRKSGLQMDCPGYLKVCIVFYKRIYELVDDPSSDSFISWGKSNKSFVITSPKEFVLKKHLSRFSCNTFKQFFRRLKYYGFKEIKLSGKLWEFGNRNFVRGQPERMVEMYKKAMLVRTSDICRREKAKAEVVDRLQNLRI